MTLETGMCFTCSNTMSTFERIRELCPSTAAIIESIDNHHDPSFLLGARTTYTRKEAPRTNEQKTSMSSAASSSRRQMSTSR
ncbi:hypothetical protein PsorP6_004639 [Peronosclerospora sorghi]|uniref:Uncharacterized protein n=1 Tax=Peronosclerospora sorghi TaxID=230839 RepID=A0ACC0VLQ1_9STRA|nr:hypothetical protein PsorP6_004639 [Peronosclerospora sorghi]